MASERYEVEVLTPQQERKITFSDLDEAAIRFYHEVAIDYREPSTNINLHDLVAGKTLAAWMWNPDDALGRVEYNIS